MVVAAGLRVPSGQDAGDMLPKGRPQICPTNQVAITRTWYQFPGTGISRTGGERFHRR
jgi:hypothetical protein